MVFRAKIVDIHDESDFLTVKVGLVTVLEMVVTYWVSLIGLNRLINW